MGHNLPDDTYPGDPRAPWNREEPGEFRVIGEVTVAADAVVSERDSKDVHHAILMEAVRKHLPDGFDVVGVEIMEREPIRD